MAVEEHARWVQWLKFAGFLGVGAVVLLVSFAMAAQDRPEMESPGRADDALIFISSSQEVGVIDGSSCLTIAETDDLIQMTPRYFVATIRDGPAREESVAACLRDRVAADVRADPL